MDFITLLNQYEKEIQEKHQKLTKILSSCDYTPSDSIQEKRHGDRTYYYKRSNYGGRIPAKEHYIPKANTKLISKLLQMQYAAKTKPYYEKQLKLLHDLQTTLETAVDTRFYERLSDESKHYLSPLVPYQTDIINKWNEMPYVRNQYHIEEAIHDTIRGEKLRSKSEVAIANALFHANLPYKIEPKIIINGQPMYPDFQILRTIDYKEIIWEHFGLMSDPNYADRACKKIQYYELAGYHLGDNFIATFETLQSPLSSRLVDDYINRYFVNYQ